MKLDLSFTESEEMLQKAALDFISREATKEVVRNLQESVTGYTEELWRKAVQMGWLGMVIPEQYGGVDNSLLSAGILYEAMGTAPLPGPYFSSGILSSLLISAVGTEEQKEQILPGIVSGTKILTLALTEPSYGWQPEVIETIADRNEGGGFTLNGTKLFVHDAGAATHFLVVARTGEATKPADGISLLVVDKTFEGISVGRLPGFFCGQTFEVKFDSVKVTQSALLGEENRGWQSIKDAIVKAIPVLCAYKVGGIQSVFDMTLAYSRLRVQFGTPIGRFQRVQDMIIEMVNFLEAARWTTYEALWKLDTNRPAIESAHLAKAVTSEAYWQVCTLAHRVFSGIGYSKEHPLTFHTRASRYLYSYLGDPPFHRQQLGQLLIG